MSVMGASAAGTVGTATEVGEPRVRELAREAVTLMAFSAGVSLTVFLIVLLGFWLGH
ncbi:hypothetical protein SFC88_07455 [Nocardioides sp. HM23]|nr:hypothetical protein [Nocardioides sp. HM23]MDZ5620654.1 hypothetical protein [Nocardioides sp. HM23]